MLGNFRENKRIVAYCLFVCLGMTSCAFNITLMLGFNSFRVQFGNAYDGQYVVPAMYQALWNGMEFPAGLVGSICAGPIGNILGRRFMFIFPSAILILAVLLQNIALDWKVMTGARFLAFLAMIMYCIAVPTYISEIAPPKIRGALLAQVSFFFLLGQFLTSCVLRAAQDLSGNLQFRVPIILQYIAPGILVTTAWFLPEPPSWLVEHGKTEAARTSLVRLYGSRVDIDDRLSDVETSAAMNRSTSRKVKYHTCFKDANLRRTIIAIGVIFSQQLAGIFFILSYSTYFFILSGVKESQAFTITSIMFALQLLANIVSWFLIEKVGRRAMLLSGLTIIAISYLIIGGIGTNNSYTSGIRPRVVVSFMIILTIAGQLSINTVGWVVASEVSSLELRASTQSLAILVNSTIGFAISFATPYILNPDQGNLGPKIGFVFAGMTSIALIFSFFMVPEMKGKSFQDLDYMFQKRIPTWKFKGFVVPTTIVQQANEVELKDDNVNVVSEVIGVSSSRLAKVID